MFILVEFDRILFSITKILGFSWILHPNLAPQAHVRPGESAQEAPKKAPAKRAVKEEAPE